MLVVSIREKIAGFVLQRLNNALKKYRKRYWLECRMEPRPFPMKELALCLFWVVIYKQTRQWNTQSLYLEKSMAEAYHNTISWSKQ